MVCSSPLGDVTAAAEDHLAVTGPEPDLALGDDGVLVLPGVQMRRHQRADRERVLHDRQGAAGVAAPELEHHADRAQVALRAAAWLHHGDGGSLIAAHV
jgi:hypothetical protein